MSGDVFPEHAWIREINVVDWGSANNLVLGKTDSWMQFQGDNLSRLNAIEIGPANSNPTFGVGELPMGTYIAEDGFDIDNRNSTAPVVDIEWSCETISPSHYSIVATPTLYGMDLDSLGIPGLTQPHQVLAYLDANESIIRVWLEGRYWDSWEVPVVDVGSGNYSFDYRFQMNGVVLQGIHPWSGKLIHS